jgi:hypothetical protein
LTGGGRKNPVPAGEGLTTDERQQLQRLRLASDLQPPAASERDEQEQDVRDGM